MKIIFLDIDGVLINIESLRKASGVHSKAHPDCVAVLNRITDETGALIVISSTWRIFGISKCKDHLSEWGVTGKVRGITPELKKEGSDYESADRGVEIRKWLNDWERDRGPVESFVILDDDDWEFDGIGHLHIKPEFETGLTMEHADRAIALLNG